jgi:hypothetical protein
MSLKERLLLGIITYCGQGDEKKRRFAKVVDEEGLLG